MASSLRMKIRQVWPLGFTPKLVTVLSEGYAVAQFRSDLLAGLTVAVVGGSPVPSTTEATAVAMTYEFTDTADNGGQGLITVKFTSPSGLITSVPIPVSNQVRPSVCAL